MQTPMLGRMCAPDNLLHPQYGTQRFNRYTYALNNPLKYTDPTGEFVWIPIAIGAVVGAYIGGTMANNNYNLTKWDFSTGRTWSWMAGGAIVGGISGRIGAAVASGGGMMANTMGIVSSPFINSVGTTIYTGGRTDVSVSFGLGSYNFNTGSFGYLGKKGNSAMENIGYGFGAFTNATDITALIQGAYNSPANLRLKTDGHTEFWDENGNQVFSWGVNKANGEPLLHGVPFKDRIPYAFKNLKENLTINYDNGTDGVFARWSTIRNVNMEKFMSYGNSLIRSGKYYRFSSVLPFGLGNAMHCTIAGSNALFHGGVFNIPLFRMPWFLDIQMRARDYTHLGYLLTP